MKNESNVKIVYKTDEPAMVDPFFYIPYPSFLQE